MNLLLISSVVLAVNIVMLYIYQQKAFFIKIYSNFNTNEKMDVINRTDNVVSPQQLLGSQNTENQTMDTSRLNDLDIENAELSKRLKALEFITKFEIYLSDNKIDRERFNEFKDFNDLKLLTQKSILEAAKRVSNLSAA
ncbi:hypothetical protein ACFSKN_11740 [Mariniflexile gromovii]|uniref:Uncharacterized protein n=1 Tax=Mariniflexile gromovii TaxID=362523 RepID=A0ABS4BVF4_9FLAO|nr:hypothetical protein [Mariniflexile gromovii]MBP0904565.1 hypothetical protein [Mariniflexile gromovii]